MVKTLEEIIEPYQKEHDFLTQNYYVYKTFTKESFDILHAQNWRDMEDELIDEGFGPGSGLSLEERVQILEDNLNLVINSRGLGDSPP